MQTHYNLCFFFVLFSLTLLGKENSNYLLQPVISEFTEDTNETIILNEHNEITITGKKADYIYFNVYKKLNIKILSLNEVKKYSKFVLPETFDPTYFTHSPKDRNYENVYSHIKISFFTGKIINKNGEIRDAEIKKSIDEISMVMENNRYGTYKKYIYKINNLSIDDELIIEYKYNVKYIENTYLLSSFRIFFHNDLFKQNYSLTLNHSPKLNINIKYYNNAAPDSIINTKEKKSYYWQLKNIYGCINEDGARPYMSLPYLVFSIKPYELLYTIPYTFEERFIPFYSLFAYQRERKQLSILTSVYQGVKTKQYLQINKFIENETRNIENDSTGYLKLKKLHNTIVDEFQFVSDIDYFKEYDTRDERIGNFVSKKTIRDISRYNLYAALISKINLDFYTTYLIDKRIGQISDDYFAPMYDSDYLLSVILKNGHLQYLYPKKSQYGYYLNEIPFYFENATTRLVCLNDYLNRKKPINECFRTTTTPRGSIKENIRINNILVDINLDDLSLNFNSKTTLSGQYSTLIRGLYQHEHKDLTINELYNKKIWEINNNVELISNENKILNKEYPFQASIKAQYKCNDLLKIYGDTITLNLKNWFNFIIYNDFDINNRQLDFYPDFFGQDTYTYFLQFNKNIKLLNTFENVEIENDFGKLTITIEQIKTNSVKISGFFAITHNVVPVNKIVAVKNIYDKIQELNSSFLKFELE
ncbi:MAG: hypothetical protein KAT68_12610 [Bacteroidales bacterium]|nr:hypothetical protein [Bacteroidales bacterium]